MQTQLAHEKYGLEVLISEHQETLNNENQKIIDSLKSENETLKKISEHQESLNNKNQKIIDSLESQNETLKKISEHQETLNNKNQKIIDILKSENETLTKKNAELEENYSYDKMNENVRLNSTIRELKRSDLTKTESLPNLTAIGNDHPIESTLSISGETTKYTIPRIAQPRG